MRRLIYFRPVLAAALALAVVAQPLAGNLCHCSEHGDVGIVAGAHSDSHGHGEPQGAAMAEHDGMTGHGAAMMGEQDSMVPDHAGADGCESPDGACQCDACSQGFGLIVQAGESFTVLPARGAAAPPHYLEPPESRALRPPIHA